MNPLQALVIIAALLFAAAAFAADESIERGRYLIETSGCNDCHTAGYAQAEGKVPEAQWLTGDRLGWRGPWGTTYGTNLRLFVSGLTEAQRDELRSRAMRQSGG